MNNCEILAPAASFEMLEAAVHAGANAVYVGLKDFNARRNANNFTLDELRLAAEYCRIRGVKIYLALNILIEDPEFCRLVPILEEVCNIGVDAVIVQDLGLFNLLKRCAKDLKIHASTQMSVHSKEGVKMLKALGFSRVVLARELSKAEITHIAENTNIELEVFVHGAHCMSVSGQCYLSAFIGSRSGNRGLCGQACRLPFASKSNTNALSLKDLSIIDRIPKLCDLGISSFKIEGRMKRPEYVTAAVTACLDAVSNSGNALKSLETLKSVFSRSGFTSGYYDNARNADMFGIRTKEDVAEKKLLKSVKNSSLSERQSVSVTAFFELRRNEPARLTVSDGGHTAAVTGEVPEQAVNRALDTEVVMRSVSKLGGTPYHLEKLGCDIEKGLTLPAAAINSLRRSAVRELSLLRGRPEPIRFEYVKIELDKPGKKTKKQFTGIFKNMNQIPENADQLSRIFVPLDTNAQAIENLQNKGSEVGVSVPRLLFDEEKMKDRLKMLKERGVQYALCENLAAHKIAADLGLKAIDGTGMNVFNSFSAKLLEEMQSGGIILSMELKAAGINRLETGLETGIFAYGRPPVMLTRACPLSKPCGRCSGEGVLKDRKGISFKVICSKTYQEVLNAYPVYIADRLNEFSVDFFALSFTGETKDECFEIIESYQNEKPPKEGYAYTRGLYWRGVL